MKPTPELRRFSLLAGSSLLAISPASAVDQDGTWSGVNGNWSNSGIWTGGLIANGANYTLRQLIPIPFTGCVGTAPLPKTDAWSGLKAVVKNDGAFRKKIGRSWKKSEKSMVVALMNLFRTAFWKETTCHRESRPAQAGHLDRMEIAPVQAIRIVSGPRWKCPVWHLRLRGGAAA